MAETLEMVGTLHVWIDNVCCTKLKMFAMDVIIDEEPIIIIASIHNGFNRFIIDDNGKLYSVRYGYGRDYIGEWSTKLLYDASLTGISIQKIFCNHKFLFVLDELNNLYKIDIDVCQGKQFMLIGKDVADAICYGNYCVWINKNHEICNHSCGSWNEFGLDTENIVLTKKNVFFLPRKVYHENGFKFCLSADGELFGNNCMIAKNVMHVDIVRHDSSSIISDAVALIYSHNNNISYRKFHDGKIYNDSPTKNLEKTIKINAPILNVFINYHIVRFRGLTRRVLMYCYVTTDGIYEINCATDESILLTKNIAQYVNNVEYIQRSMNIKSARNK